MRHVDKSKPFQITYFLWHCYTESLRQKDPEMDILRSAVLSALVVIRRTGGIHDYPGAKVDDRMHMQFAELPILYSASARQNKFQQTSPRYNR